MSSGTMTPHTPSHDAGASDVDLTAQAIQHNLNKLPTTNGTSNGTPAELDASKLITTLTTNYGTVPTPETATAGPDTICTDHMITCAWSASKGWAAPELKPYGPLSLMPTASVLHYATECFEGLKAYRGHDGKLRLFRPDLNAARFLTSATRIALPAFAPDQLEALLVALVAQDGAKWLPKSRPGTFLYLRPAMIGTQAALGVQAPREALLFITASYMSNLHATPGGMKLHTSPEDMVRAWVGGFGYAKVGANYGPSLLATAEARARGFGQVLWLYGSEGYCTEAGASNFFVVMKEKTSGKTQIVTAPLDDRLILDGITRRSVLQLARERLGDDVDVVERRYTIKEVSEAAQEGRLVESFAAGTAYFVTPISLIHHRGKDITINMGESGEGGKYALALRRFLEDIQYGGEDHPWAVVVKEEE